jgi:hypothetical protein
MTFNKDAFVRTQLIEQIKVGLSTYMHTYMKGLTNRPKSTRSCDMLCAGFAEAIREYEQKTGMPMSQTLVTYLLDNTKESA